MILKNMKTAIIGSGAVGGYFGGRLAAAGTDVTFLARGAHLAALQANGLTVKSILGDFRVFPVKAREKIIDMGLADLILVCVKAWQIREISEELKSIMHPGTIILPVQNGILASEELAETIDRKHILGGLCRIISLIEAPGVIRHDGITPTIVFGETDGSVTARVRELEAMFTAAGIKAQVSTDIEADLWKKFISICVSGLLAVTHSTYGQLREDPVNRRRMIDLLTEGYDVSQKLGIKIESGFVEKTVSFIDSFPYDTTLSLTRDVWEGKPSEIEYQNGTVIRLGEKVGVATPVNRWVYERITGSAG
jgi:2-dehydropantoate 2-reductase